MGFRFRRDRTDEPKVKGNQRQSQLIVATISGLFGTDVANGQVGRITAHHVSAAQQQSLLRQAHQQGRRLSYHQKRTDAERTRPARSQAGRNQQLPRIRRQTALSVPKRTVVSYFTR